MSDKLPLNRRSRSIGSTPEPSSSAKRVAQRSNNVAKPKPGLHSGSSSKPGPKSKTSRDHKSGVDSFGGNGESRVDSDLNDLNGFERGLKVEKILGVMPENNGLMFYIVFKDSDYIEKLPSQIVNIKVPQLVIQFYEQHVVWP